MKIWMFSEVLQSWRADIFFCVQTWVSLMLQRGSKLWRSAVACQRGELWPIPFCPATALISLTLAAASGQRLTVSLKTRTRYFIFKYLFIACFHSTGKPLFASCECWLLNTQNWLTLYTSAHMVASQDKPHCCWKWGWESEKHPMTLSPLPPLASKYLLMENRSLAF